MHPNVLNQYYGAEGALVQRCAGQTGAGHSDDEDDTIGDLNRVGGLASNIAQDQESDIRHEAVEVPMETCPFDVDTELLFVAALREVQQHNPIPDGYHVSPNEWPSDGYPVQEHIKVRGGSKLVSVALPFELWWQRAVRWSQGLDLMVRFMVEEE